jgi:3-hydroxy-9,10-secoandrosta-1,3,5(10)-triene-9,17-dione monooxygenase
MVLGAVEETGALLTRAASVGEVAAAHGAASDRDRRLAPPVIEALAASGLLRLLRPRRLGGLEAEPRQYVEVIREIARYDVNAAWVYGVLSIHEWFVAYVSAELQHDLWDEDPDAIVVDSIAPVGKAEAADGGFRVSGTWKFVSGVEWCSWIAVNAITQLPDGEGPEPVLYFIPRGEVAVADEWHVVGLRGTASNTVTVADVFVPAHRTLPLARVAASGRPQGEVLDDGPLYRVPFVPMLAAGLFPVSLGGAQQALESFQRWTEGRIRPYSQGAEERQMPSAQLSFAECSTRWDAAHALAIRYAEDLYELGRQGTSALADADRARFFSWRGWIARTSAELSDRLFLDSGGNALFEDHPMQKAWRDTHAAAQHVSLGYGDAMNSRGRTGFGLPGHPLM